VNCYPIQSRGNHNPALALELWRTIRKVDPDIVQTWLTQMDVLGGILCGQRAKLILSERASALGYPASFKNRLRHAIGVRADCVIANSRKGAEYWDGAARVETIPNGVDLQRIDSAPVKAGAGADLLRGRKAIVTVGRLSEQKQFETLIEATDRVRHEIPEVLLLIFGEGIERRKLEGLVDRLQLRDHVHFGGYVADIPSWMKAARLFASSSIFEGQPNVVLEAAAARVPMVLSDIPEHRELIGDAAAYAPPGEPCIFANVIVELLRHPERAADTVQGARETVERLSFDAVADAYASLYVRLTQAP
jgi:glycosyltransferase involved in cell wall biosynthesis